MALLPIPPGPTFNQLLNTTNDVLFKSVSIADTNSGTTSPINAKITVNEGWGYLSNITGPYLILTSAYPFAITLPNITPTGQVEGTVYTCDNGLWSFPPLSYAYQWQRSVAGDNWVNINGATTNSYTSVNDDINNFLRCRVTATTYFGSGEANSLPVGPVIGPILIPNCLVYWPLGRSAVAGKINLNDATGNGYNLTLNGSATLSTTGGPGTHNFYYATFTNDGVSNLSHGAASYLNGRTQFSFVCWVRFPDNNRAFGIFNTPRGFGVRATENGTDTITVGVSLANDQSATIVTDIRSGFTFTSWHQFVVTYDAGNVVIYWNAAAVSYTTQIPIPSMPTTFSSPTTLNNGDACDICLFGLSSSVLSQSQVNTLYNNGDPLG